MAALKENTKGKMSVGEAWFQTKLRNMGKGRAGGTALSACRLSTSQHLRS